MWYNTSHMEKDMRTIAAFCCLFVGLLTDGLGDGLPRVWMSTTPRRPFESTIKLCSVGCGKMHSDWGYLIYYSQSDKEDASV